MPSTTKQTASRSLVVPGYEGHFEELDGYTVAFETHSTDMDAAPLFRGLPDDRCQCPHWGYVVRGAITFRYRDREETYEAGTAYYATPGHIPVLHDGGEIVEFSPTDALGETMAVISENLAAMEAAAE